MGFGVGVKLGEAGDIPPFPFKASQDPVGQSAPSLPRHPSDLVHGLRDGSVGRDPVHIEKLIGAQAEQIQHQGGETGKPAAEMEAQQVVQAALKPNGAVGSLLDPSTIPVR